MKFSPIITCEHAGNLVPERYADLFRGAEEVLQSHRGWDPGALQVANYLAGRLHAPLKKCETTRLLVETNRSLDAPSLFSEYSGVLTKPGREDVLQHFYLPYRNEVEMLIRKLAHVLHLSIHTFTPVLHGSTRNVDVGLLFDPARENESAFCEALRHTLRTRLPALKIEFNEPYKGIDDGFTTHLRMLFDNMSYLGIEIEINQKHVGSLVMESIRSSLATGILDYLERN